MLDCSRVSVISALDNAGRRVPGALLCVQNPWRVDAPSILNRYKQLELRRVTRPTFFLIALFCFAATAVGQVPPEIPKRGYPKLDSQLAKVVEAVDSGAAQMEAATVLRNRAVVRDMVPVTIRTSSVATLESWLQSRGFTVSNALGDTLETYLTPDALRSASALREVISIRQIVPAEPLIVGQGPCA